MTDQEIFDKCFTEIQKGNFNAVFQILLNLYNTTRDIPVKLNSLIMIITSLSVVDHYDFIIKICDNGLQFLNGQLKDVKARLLSAKAAALHVKRIPYVHERGLIKLSPDWINFSLEKDKARYDELTKKINNIDSTVSSLLEEAESLINGIPESQSKATVMISLALAYGQSLDQYKLENFKIGKFVFFRHALEFIVYFKPLWFLFFTREEVEFMTKEMYKVKDLFLNSARIAVSLSDFSLAGYAYYNLSNQFRGTFFLRKFYLFRASRMARKSKDPILLRKIKQFYDKSN